MTVTVIARDAEGKKSTWHWTPQTKPISDEHPAMLARKEVWDQVSLDTKRPPLAVLALVPK